MTTARITAASQNQTGLDLIVARIAVALLRWSNRRAISASIGHDQMMLLRANSEATARRPVFSVLVP